ncbi:hypothetical protein B0J13DRAFT_520749 [Dactylonectria estremocensis]|uniref:Uncharacterized protein n=1 Tax=Dactylonectria estremocensis TaxID=1079267 RepID=A0A9P9FCT4_9HYPO|nr:hypothetical protein B0J13DRAFT_520749 [Dactylonectria estremocensis]
MESKAGLVVGKPGCRGHKARRKTDDRAGMSVSLIMTMYYVVWLDANYGYGMVPLCLHRSTLRTPAISDGCAPESLTPFTRERLHAEHPDALARRRGHATSSRRRQCKGRSSRHRGRYWLPTTGPGLTIGIAAEAGEPGQKQASKSAHGRRGGSGTLPGLHGGTVGQGGKVTGCMTVSGTAVISNEPLYIRGLILLQLLAQVNGPEPPGRSHRSYERSS